MMVRIKFGGGNNLRAHREAKAAAARRRDLLNAQALAYQLDRTPTRKELEEIAVWFGPRNPWPDYQTFVAAMGGTKEDGRRYRYSKAGAPASPTGRKTKPARQMVVETRRCEACLQLTTLAPECRHCGAAWVRTRAA